MAKAVKYLEGLTIHKVPYNIANTSDFKTNVMGKAADNELFIITDTPTFSLKIGNVTYDGTSNVSATTATQSASGLMSAADKKKLDGIATGATKITVDTALSSSSTNPVQNKVINSALSGKAGTSVATTSANGLMSAADKTKLNGIATGANKTIVDTTLSDSSTNPVQNKVVKAALDNKADNTALDAKADKTALDGKLDKTGGTLTGNLTGKYFTGTWLQTTASTDLGRTPEKVAVLDQSGWVYYRTPAEIKSDIGADAVVTTSSDGLMSVDDKKKLDGIAKDATKTIIDTALDGTSTNPVQNKVVKAELDKKFNKTGGIINGSVQVNSDSNESVAIYAGRVDADDWVKATSGVTIGRGSSAGAFVSLRCDRSSDTTESLKIFRDLYAENGDLAHVTIADPIDSDHATTKKYVDTGLSGKFDKSGGTITGTVKVNGSTYCNSIFLGGYLLNTKSKGLTFEQTDNPAGVEEILAPIRIGTPENNDEATTKKYVDNADKKILKRAKSYVDSAITVAINSSY